MRIIEKLSHQEFSCQFPVFAFLCKYCICPWVLRFNSGKSRGWNTELSLVNRYFVFTVLHFDLASLYATKLHTCFFRKYTEGRDFYDLIWYFGKRILPNFELLNNAIEQTEHEKINLNADNFNDFIKEKLARVDFAEVKRDVEAFVKIRVNSNY